MEKSHTIFESGKEYSLAQIFTGNNKIIIPDLQRDYCWGDKAFNKDKERNSELVSGFIRNLIAVKNDTDVTLGLLYGYEHPKHHIQLCDGQQRITTLYLLLGMLNRKTENAFQNHLIFDFNSQKDEKEPYLQYAIRESTLYFLNDLLCHFFLNDSINVNDIVKQDWYFDEYKFDASIQSMIAALKTIETILDEKSVDCKSFGDFVLNNLQMIYYDMGNRTRGEETFVVINTSGEPLTATENLKPILLGELKNKDKDYPNAQGVENVEIKLEYYSRQWEDREEWFWKNIAKNANGNRIEPTADEGLNDFFVWYWQIRLLQEKTWKNKQSEKIVPKELFLKKPEEAEADEDKPSLENWADSTNLDTVHQYFEALQRLIKICKEEEKISKVLQTIKSGNVDLEWFRKVELHVTLPLITYLKRFSEPNYFYEFVRRIRKNYFDKIRKRANSVDWRHIIQIIDFVKDEKELFVFETKSQKDRFKSISNVNLGEWYDEDEKNKDILRQEYKSEIESWEDNEDLMGDLTPIWQANKSRDNSYENLKQIWDTFSVIYNCYDKNWSENNAILSNYVRLYRVLIEPQRIGRIPITRDMHGLWFSTHAKQNANYFNYLSSEAFLSLLKTKNDFLIEVIKGRIRELIPQENTDINEHNFTSENHLKIWILLKVLYAEKKNVCLSFYDGRGSGENSLENNLGNGLASYDDMKKNMLNNELPFSLGNSICGYAVKIKSRIIYADQEWWLKPLAFDTVIGDSITLDDFNPHRDNIGKRTIDPEKIHATDEEIKSLIDTFYKR